ncbi:hypothetical protein JAB2_45270 [Janthinobacterium sp. HH100]|nr:hypothetical protein JAB2_45270 [Janthinobacterium sp. HH100]
MLPWFRTFPVPLPENWYLPAMKSALLMSRVDATSPAVFTDAPWPNRMPFGLTMNTLPLADKLPRMVVPSPPRTRFRATALLLGCWNCTDSPLPILKLAQLITAFWLPCLITVAPGAPLIVAWPATTVPPAGPASAKEP